MLNWIMKFMFLFGRFPIVTSWFVSSSLVMLGLVTFWLLQNLFHTVSFLLLQIFGDWSKQFFSPYFMFFFCPAFLESI